MVKHTELQVQTSFLSWSRGRLHPSSHAWWVFCAPKTRACRWASQVRSRTTPAQLPFCKMGRDRDRIWKVYHTVPSDSLNGNSKVTKSTPHLPPSRSGRRRGGAAAGPPAPSPPEGAAPGLPAAFLPAQAPAHPPNAPAALRSRLSGSRAARGRGWRRRRRGAGQEVGARRRGGAERASRDGGVRRRAQGGDCPPRGSRRGARPPRERWRRKKVTARGPALRLSPQVAGKRGRGGGRRAAGADSEGAERTARSFVGRGGKQRGRSKLGIE